MRAAPRPEPVGETPEVRLIDSVQHLNDGPLDDLVLQAGDGAFILPLLQARVGMCIGCDAGGTRLPGSLGVIIAGDTDATGLPGGAWCGGPLV